MCGIFGIFNHEDAATLTALGLHSLQHRGQESAGIATSDQTKIYTKKDTGLIANVFNDFDVNELKGGIGIGHTRYSTTGSDSKQNAQPLIVEGINGELALGHNGNIVNSEELKDKYLSEFDIDYITTADTEVIAYMYVNSVGKDWFEKSNYCMRYIKGAFSLVMMTKDELIKVEEKVNAPSKKPNDKPVTKLIGFRGN